MGITINPAPVMRNAMEHCLYNKKGIAHITHAIRPTILSTIVIPPYILIFTGYAINAGLLRYASPTQMVCRRFVNGILRKAGVIFVPLYENKKSLGMPELDFLGVT